MSRWTLMSVTSSRCGCPSSGIQSVARLLVRASRCIRFGKLRRSPEARAELQKTLSSLPGSTTSGRMDGARWLAEAAIPPRSVTCLSPISRSPVFAIGAITHDRRFTAPAAPVNAGRPSRLHFSGTVPAWLPCTFVIVKASMHSLL